MTSDSISSIENRYTEAVKKISEGRQAIFQCLSDAEELISSGVIDLSDNAMRNIVWNNIAQFAYKHGLFSDSEYVNKHLLLTLERFDSAYKIPRGQALYNLGISQINQRNFDEGIPNVLNALSEDESLYGKQKASQMRATLVRDQLYIFTVSIIDREFMGRLRASVQLNTNKKTNTIDIISVFPDIADRLLLAKSVNIYHNLPFKHDTYSKILMFDNLKTLCLLFENCLRIKGQGVTLKPLIRSVFDSETWHAILATNYDSLTHFLNPSPSQALQNFEDKLRQIRSMRITNKDEFLAYMFLEGAKLRNLTAHLFDLGVSILDNESQYKKAFHTVILCLLYSLHFQS